MHRATFASSRPSCKLWSMSRASLSNGSAAASRPQSRYAAPKLFRATATVALLRPLDTRRNMSTESL